MEHIFSEIGLIVIAASFLGVISHFTRQPLILAYILAGILIGPYGFGLLHDSETIHIISEIGILLLLFLVGIEMNTDKLKTLGKVAFTVGLSQVVITGSLGYLIALAFGFDQMSAAYISLAITLSSTVIAIKMLSEKKDLNSFYGQVVIGILLVQDILAVLALVFLAGVSASFSILSNHVLDLLLGSFILISSTMFISTHLLSRLLNKIGNSMELIILVSLAWCFLIAGEANYMGLSKEIGAFLAGVSLANLPYAYEISAKSKYLRDFFIIIFFVSLGAGMMFSEIGSNLLPLVVFAVFVIIGNPLIVMVAMKFLKYDKRNSFFTGMLIANISEFSLIIATLGYRLGHITLDVFSFIMIIGMTTMAISSYMITYKESLFRFFKKRLHWKKRRLPKSHAHPKLSNHIILLGCDHTGEQILQQIKEFKDEYLVVDHDNEVINRLMHENIPCIFGDVEDEDLLRDLNLSETELIISTMPNPADNYFIIKEINTIEDVKKRPIFIAVVGSGREGIELFEKGADYVIVKSYLGASHIKEINKRLYSLDGELNAQGPKKAEDLTHKSSDVDYAQVLEKLNAVRLGEIQGKKKLHKEK